MSLNPRRIVALVVGVVVAVLVTYALVSLVAQLFTDPALAGDDGELTEQLFALDPAVPRPALTDVTALWGLDSGRTRGENRLRGGVALGDLDGDGRLDIVTAGGALIAYLARGDGYERVVAPDIGDVISVTLADLDGDGQLDAMAGTRYSAAAVVWGGSWTRGATVGQLASSDVDITRLGSQDAFTTGLLAGDFNGDALLDLVQLDYDSFDMVWTQVADREFRPSELPNSDRQSMAAAIADVDGDGLSDIWVTRDVGWVTGADSLYSRDGDRDGRFADIARDMGVDLELDGMGVTIADFDGDAHLDAYISDLGDNELLAGSGTGGEFTKLTGRGVGHIRPVGASDDLISSSWTSGVTDINHDGLLDLIVANGGFLSDMVPNKIEGSTIADGESPSVFINRGDGTYADVWPELGIDWSGLSRGMALGDLDNDGDADIVINNHGGGLLVLRNDTPGPVSKLTLTGCSAAVVSAATSTGSVMAVIPAHGFLSGHAPELTIGGGPDGEEIAGEGAEFAVNGVPVSSLTHPCN